MDTVRFIERNARRELKAPYARQAERVCKPMENSHLNCRTWRGRLIDSSKPSLDYTGKADATEKFFQKKKKKEREEKFLHIILIRDRRKTRGNNYKNVAPWQRDIDKGP